MNDNLLFTNKNQNTLFYSKNIILQLDTFQATGIAMLFSAGTFLYVATMHVLPEVTNMGGGHTHGFTKTELIMLIVGALLPLLMTIGHHH